MLASGDPDQGVEVAGELRDVAHQHPLAVRAAVATMIQRIGDQPVGAEPLRHVVIATGVLTETV